MSIANWEVSLQIAVLSNCYSKILNLKLESHSVECIPQPWPHSLIVHPFIDTTHTNMLPFLRQDQCIVAWEINNNDEKPCNVNENDRKILESVPLTRSGSKVNVIYFVEKPILHPRLMDIHIVDFLYNPAGKPTNKWKRKVQICCQGRMVVFCVWKVN